MILRHIDFQVPDWGEMDAGPTTRPGYFDEMLADHPASAWRFDEAAGSVVADSVNNRDLSLAGGYALGESGPLAFDPATAVAFDGIDGFASFADPSVLSGLPACTVTFWLRFDEPAVTDDHAILSSWQAGENGLLIWIDQVASHSGRPRTLSFAIATSPGGGQVGRVEGPTDLIRSGQWDFYACVFDGGATLAIYRGSADESVSLKMLASGVVAATPELTHPIHIASTLSPAAIGHLPGGLANLAVYHQALPLHRLQAQLNAGVGRWA